MCILERLIFKVLAENEKMYFCESFNKKKTNYKNIETYGSC